MGRKPTEKYIDPDELYTEIKSAQETRCPSEKLGTLLLTMTSHILRHRHFNGYSLPIKEELQSYALYRLLKTGIYAYDTSRPKDCFNYFTCAIFNNYYNALGKHYRHVNNQQKLMKHMLQMAADLLPTNASLHEFASSFQSADEK